MLTHHRTGHIFMSAILKDRLRSAVARFSVPSSIELLGYGSSADASAVCFIVPAADGRLRAFELSRRRNLDL